MDETMTCMLKPVIGSLHQIQKHTKPQGTKPEPIKHKPIIFRRTSTPPQKLTYKFPAYRDLYTASPRPVLTSTPVSSISRMRSRVQDEEEDDDEKEDASYVSPDPDPDDSPMFNETFRQRRLNPKDKSVVRLFSSKPSSSTDGTTWHIGLGTLISNNYV